MVRRSTSVRDRVGAVDDQRVVEKLVGQPAEADGRSWMRATMARWRSGSVSSAASSAWARTPATGVRSWCEASAIRLRMISTWRAWRAMKRLIAPTRLADLARDGDVERRQVARLARGEPALDRGGAARAPSGWRGGERGHGEADQADDEERAAGDLAASASRARVVWPTTTSTVPVKSRSEKGAADRGQPDAARRRNRPLPNAARRPVDPG